MNKRFRITAAIQSALIDQTFIDKHRRIPTAFTRNRKLTFGTVVATILSLAKRSLQIVCNLLGARQMIEPASKQAFSKARYKISYTGFKALNDILLNEAYRGDNEGLWRGFRLFGTDGSTIRLPKSEETLEYFGETNGENQHGTLLARISEIVELTTGIVVSGDLAPTCLGERIIAKDQIRAVSAFFHELGQNKQLFIFDRGYISREMILDIYNAKADFMFRVPSGFNKAIDEAVKAGKTDLEIQLYPDCPLMRLTIRNLPSKEKCILLTSILDVSISGENFFKLYWMRWGGCEEGYKKQKIALELENFSGTGVEAILQEFWSNILALNLFQVQCLGEEGAWDIDNPPSNRINRNVVFGSLKEVVFDVILGEITHQEFEKVFKAVASRGKIKVRPGRSYSREKVGKPKRNHVFRRV